MLKAVMNWVFFVLFFSLFVALWGAFLFTAYIAVVILPSPYWMFAAGAFLITVFIEFLLKYDEFKSREWL